MVSIKEEKEVKMVECGVICEGKSLKVVPLEHQIGFAQNGYAVIRTFPLKEYHIRVGKDSIDNLRELMDSVSGTIDTLIENSNYEQEITLEFLNKELECVGYNAHIIEKK